MVQTYERPTEQIETIDRPIGRSFFIESQLFYLANKEALFSSQSLIHQVSSESQAFTLYFDMQNSNEACGWQLVYANKKGRTVTNVSVNKHSELSGWSANYDKSGSVKSCRDLEPSEAANISRSITSWLSNSEDLTSDIDNFSRQREECELAVAKFIINHEVVLTAKKSALSRNVNITKVYWDDDNKCYMANALIKVQGKAYRAELKKHEDRLSHVGFSPTSLAPKPKSR